MVAAVRTKQLFWFIRRRGKFKPLPKDADGIIRSDVLPGFWLDAEAFLNRDSKRLRAALRRHREKVAQALDNIYGWDACVTVCAFSAAGHRIRISRHGLSEA
jgi:hypothetical protein